MYAEVDFLLTLIKEDDWLSERSETIYEEHREELYCWTEMAEYRMAINRRAAMDIPSRIYQRFRPTVYNSHAPAWTVLICRTPNPPSGAMSTTIWGATIEAYCKHCETVRPVRRGVPWRPEVCRECGAEITDR